MACAPAALVFVVPSFLTPDLGCETHVSTRNKHTVRRVQPSPPPGWYVDSRGTYRYWSGTYWTEHTAPLPASPPMFAQVTDAAEQPKRQKRRWPWVVGMLVLLSLMGGVALVGVLVGRTIAVGASAVDAANEFLDATETTAPLSSRLCDPVKEQDLRARLAERGFTGRQQLDGVYVTKPSGAAMTAEVSGTIGTVNCTMPAVILFTRDKRAPNGWCIDELVA